MISGPFTAKKFASVSWATARAIRVLPQPGGPCEQDSLGRVDAQPLEDLGIAERQLDDLANAVQLALQAADILVGERPVRLRSASAEGPLDRPDWDRDNLQDWSVVR